MVRLQSPYGVAVASLALLSAAAAEQMPLMPVPGRTPLTDEFADFVRQKLDRWKVPGMSLAVIDGHDIYAQGYGYATLPDRNATAETLWYGASTTKAQTAAVLAHLIDSGAHPELADGWATKISSIIRDDFVLDDAWATSHVTLEDAASHRTGMPRHDKASASVVNGTQVTPRDVVRNLRNLRLNREPRLVFQYCNLMYVVLGHVIETVTGKSLASVMRHVIWEPLAMDSTYLGLGDVFKDSARLATGYYWDEQARVHRDIPPMSLTELAGAGSAISTVVDYAQWVRCLLHEAAPFSKRVHAEFKKPRILGGLTTSAGLDISLYSLGWERNLYNRHVMYTHSGGLDGFGAQVYWLPEARFGVVAFANTARTSNAVEDVVIYRLIGDKFGIPERERFDFDKKWRDAIDNTTRPMRNVDRIVFPHHPTPPLPSTFKIEELEGRYWDAGYGEFSLRQEPHPDRRGDKILVADRDYMTWRYQLRLHHASGDYWIVYLATPRNPTFVNEFQPGEFTRGVDGNVSGLEVRWLNRQEAIDEGKVTFMKLS